MKHDQIKDLTEENFRRLTGIKKETFNKMIVILEQAQKIKKAKGGRKNKLSIEDQLLLTLGYLREYRTLFHVGQSFGVSESSAFQTVRWVENTLIKHPDFALPGKKTLTQTDNKSEVILIDVTESPIERPKKNRKNPILAKRKDTP